MGDKMKRAAPVFATVLLVTILVFSRVGLSDDFSAPFPAFTAYRRSEGFKLVVLWDWDIYKEGGRAWFRYYGARDSDSASVKINNITIASEKFPGRTCFLSEEIVIQGFGLKEHNISGNCGEQIDINNYWRDGLNVAIFYELPDGSRGIERGAIFYKPSDRGSPFQALIDPFEAIFLWVALFFVIPVLAVIFKHRANIMEKAAGKRVKHVKKSS